MEANSGTAQVTITDAMISLTGENSIIGRTMVIHAGQVADGHVLVQ